MKKYKILSIVLLSGIGLSLATCSDSGTERENYWRQSVNKEIPIGTDKDKIFTWAKMHAIELGTISDHRLDTIIEHIPVRGISFPCSEWDIRIEIIFDGSDSRSIKQKLYRVGVCL